MTIDTDVFFAGVGVMEIGLERGGLTIRRSFEIDGKCCRVQRANFRHEVVQVDIARKLVTDYPRPDVMVATWPCTKYSDAADIHGTRTGDELYLHFLRHLAIHRPEIFVAENVPGMRKFPLVMETMTKLAGYYVQVFCPVSSQLWLPQRRDRLIIIGSRRRFAWRPPTARRRVKLADILEEHPQVTRPKIIDNRLDGKYRDLPIISDPARDDIAPTCVAHYGKDLSTRLVVDRRHPRGVRAYSVREWARLQGVPDWFTFDCSASAAYTAIGNAVSVPVGEWVGREVTRYFKSSRS